MRQVVVAFLAFLIAATPMAASAQADIAPPVVQSLEDPKVVMTVAPWIGAVAGSALAIVGVNAWTGGALLAPTLGPVVSGVLGGSWLGLSALTPIGTRALLENTTLIAVGVSGGLFGHWLGSR
ncbi:hypothetical protein [Thalassobaculum sp.]|uniref:hypothetical protein n=1 Tax=Thalassobaculum sp. TaxID=2022740 RepID=UPI0032ECD5ED